MNIDNVKKMLVACADADDTLLMEGLHGIGKSQIVSSFAKENDYHMETLFLSHQEVGDLIGMPRTVEKVIGKKIVQTKDEYGLPKVDEYGDPVEVEVDDVVHLTTWTKPVWLQRMEEASAKGKKTVLFLDELNRAPIDVRQTALQLVLERQIHEHILPTTDGYRALIVAAVNPSSDYQVEEMDPALLDRFLSVHVDVDVNSWLTWAGKNDINNIVRNYIAENPKRLHIQPLPDENEDSILVGATPRSYSALSKFIDNKDNIDPEIMFQIIQGKIGKENGAQFYQYMKNYSDDVKVEDVERVVNETLTDGGTMDEIAMSVTELTSHLEAIQKRDLIDQLSDKYIGEDVELSIKEVYPLLGMLYSVEVEILNAYLKTTKETREIYAKLTEADKVLNNKRLFLRIISKFN